MPHRPTQIKRIEGDSLSITWNDGRVDLLSFKELRDACPCAGCKGETILFKSYSPPEIPDDTPGKYTLIGVSTVGTYAIKIEWGDGHDTGLYSFDYLRNMR